MQQKAIFIVSHHELYYLSVEEIMKLGRERVVVHTIELDPVTIEKLILLLETAPIKTLEFRKCDFTKVKSCDFSKARMLTEVTCRDGDKQLSFVLNCLTIPHLRRLIITSPDREMSLKKMRSTLPTNLTDIADRLENNYSLAEFNCEDIETYLASNAGLRNLSQIRKMVVEASSRIDAYVERNRLGRKRCRDVIYTLFLIKYYSSNNVFRFMDKHVLMVIAKHLYASIGTKSWCE